MVNIKINILNHVNCDKKWANIKHTLYEDLDIKNELFRRVCKNGGIYVFWLEINV